MYIAMFEVANIGVTSNFSILGTIHPLAYQLVLTSY